uniref:glycoside hydrolase family 5 protein n=1 Tax=Stappia sp. TaxID=1870903 RepID=UPI003BAA3E2C
MGLPEPVLRGGALALAALLSLAQPVAAAECLRGANAAGAEFGYNIPGVFGRDYTYPSAKTLAYLRSKGMNVVRLPFRWERLQPKLDAPFDPVELKRLTDTVKTITDLGMTVVLDPSNFAKHFDDLVGSRRVPLSSFADFWRRLAPLWAGRDDVIYLVMNEPAYIDAKDWLPANNAALAAIRETGADNFVLVAGTIWTAAVHWYADQPGGSNAEVMRGVVDPMNHFGFDIHQYLDDDYSGTKPACNKVEEAMEALKRVTAWMEETGNRAFLGEFGGYARPDCYRGLARVVGYLNSRPDIWLGWSIWAAGDWWGDYPLSIQPNENGDRPQLTAIERFIPRTRPEEKSCKALERR